MGRSDLERLSNEELIELVLRLQRPPKTSRTSSKPPSTDRKQRRDQAKPGGAKPGHEGHSRAMSPDVDRLVDHQPDHCPCCRTRLATDLPTETVSEHDTIELPAIKPWIERHRRLAVRCPTCGTRVVAPVPEAAKGTPFGPRVHAMATYLKTFQALSYERLQSAFADLFGLTLSQGGLMNMLRRAQRTFAGERDRPSRRCARPGASPLMRPVSGSRGAARTIGCFAAPRRWSITPRRPGAPSWSGR
jgi:transposase